MTGDDLARAFAVGKGVATDPPVAVLCHHISFGIKPCLAPVSKRRFHVVRRAKPRDIGFGLLDVDHAALLRRYCSARSIGPRPDKLCRCRRREQ